MDRKTLIPAFIIAAAITLGVDAFPRASSAQHVAARPEEGVELVRLFIPNIFAFVLSDHHASGATVDFAHGLRGARVAPGRYFPPSSLWSPRGMPCGAEAVGWRLDPVWELIGVVFSSPLRWQVEIDSRPADAVPTIFVRARIDDDCDHRFSVYEERLEFRDGDLSIAQVNGTRGRWTGDPLAPPPAASAATSTVGSGD